MTPTMSSSSTTTSTTTSTNDYSARYNQLLRVIDKCLSESMKATDLDECIRQTYGNDADSFGGHEMLKQVLATMLDKAHDQVKSDLSLHNEQILLRKVETIIQTFESLHSIQQHNDRVDHDSAKAALEDTNLLKHGMEPSHIFQYLSYQNYIQEQTDLQERLDAMNQQIYLLEEEYEKAKTMVASDIDSVQQSSNRLNNTADICATLS